MKKIKEKINELILKIFPEAGVKRIACSKNKNAKAGLEVDKWLKENKARLNMYEDDYYAWVDVGGFRFYFHGEFKNEEVRTLGGKKKRLASIKYDGWEC